MVCYEAGKVLGETILVKLLSGDMMVLLHLVVSLPTQFCLNDLQIRNLEFAKTLVGKTAEVNLVSEYAPDLLVFLYSDAQNNFIPIMAIFNFVQ